MRHLLCHIEEINPATGLVTQLPDGQSVVLTRYQDQVFAYLNRCPHALARLDHEQARVVALDGYHLFCSLHGALFRPDNGQCTQGPCIGQSLTPVELEREQSALYWRSSC